MENQTDQGVDPIITQTYNELIHGEEELVSNPGSQPPGAPITATPAIVAVASDYKSPNFTPGLSGWKLGSNGVIEAIGVILSGNISATSGTIGGFTIGSTDLSVTSGGNTTTLSSGATALIAGPTGSPTFSLTQAGAMTATSGVIANWNISSSALSTGNFDTSGTMYFGTSGISLSNVFKVTSAGALTASSGTIGGFTINSTALYGGIIKTALTVGVGTTGVIMDTDGLRGYDSVLGLTFELPTDGGAPTFSSGIISSTVYEINTNAVMRTSSTVGDGTANSAGILINNTGFYATEANQLLADANVRILIDGSGYFSGTFNLGGTTITIDNTQSIQDNLDTISTAGGGTLYLNPGTYTLTADVSIPAGVTLQGVSRDGVIIDCDGTYAVKITGTNIYSTGTIAISDTQTTVVGTGTTFTSGMVGRYIYLHDAWYEITVFTDTTHITISPAYSGNNLSGYATAIADVNFNATIKNLTITGATGSGMVVSHSMEPNLVNLYIYGNGTGLDLDYVIFPKLDTMTSNENGVNLNMNFVEGPYIDYSEFSYSTTGAGIIAVSANNGTIFNFSANDNTGDGINATNCDKLAYISFDISGNGGQGIEFVSGCDDNQITDGQINGNTSDNVKFTATSDRNSIVAVSIKNSGGYGINIAASTCDNNQIIAPAFDNNTSGNINDSGTGTFISPQEFVDTTATQITSLAGSEPTTWTDLDLSSVVGATTKIVLLKMTTASGRLFGFRTNGDTAEYFDDTNANSQNIIKTDDNIAGTTIVKTDSSGVIEWRGSAVTAGISFGNTTIDTDQVSGTTSHNNDGNFVFVAINSQTDDVTAMTYAGVAMTQLGTSYYTTWSARYHTTWYIVNPATGANNVVATGGTSWQFVIFSASGVDTANPVSGLTTTADASSANPTVSVTTTVDDAYAICSGQINDATVSGGTDTTLLVNGTGGGFYIFRSTADTDTAGAFTLNVTSTGDWRLRGFGLNPARTVLTVLAAW